MTTSIVYSSKEHNKEIELAGHIEKIFGYGFKDLSLCQKALTHSSLKNESEYAKVEDNEKLEFIGDAVLDLIVSNFLLSKKEYSSTEGELTINRSKIVNENSLYCFAKSISLDRYLRVSRSAKKMMIHKNKSILSDAFEALIGAIFLDSNFETVENKILLIFGNAFKSIIEDKQTNYKGILNEYVSKKKLEHPIYEIVNINGPDHNRVYYSQIIIQGIILAQGQGNSIRSAEQEAAKLAIERLGI